MEEIARGDFNAGSDAGNPRMTARRTDDGWVINGTKAVSRGLMRCEDVLVPREHLIGPGGAGFTQVMKGFDFSRALIGLQCVGTEEQTVAETREYVSHRDAVDKPLSSFRGVAFPLAEAEKQLAAARLPLGQAPRAEGAGRVGSADRRRHTPDHGAHHFPRISRMRVRTLTGIDSTTRRISHERAHHRHHRTGGDRDRHRTGHRSGHRRAAARGH
ncbi:acyl-CoA dehydrogenase family protein [Kocuria marina]|uniref:acyl-CoA dehydrogenase family protein n=1 Tax=Kocuria marina TaxID=223184 RepID=UPI0021A6750A|nr:hypothetical protein [Kocuria marina]